MVLVFHRGVIAALVLCLAVSGCASYQYDPDLSPAENRLRQRNEQFNRTVAEGGGLGVLAGALIGGLASRHHARGALIGAAAGGLVGSGAGYLVAGETQQQQEREDDLRGAIARARRVAQDAQQQAQDAMQAAREAQRHIAMLNQKVAAGQISRAAYARQAQHLRTVNAEISKSIGNYRGLQDKMRRQQENIYRFSPQAASQMRQATNSTARSIKEMQQASDILARSLGALPSSVRS